jgi:predicted dehydrogenase
VEIRPLPLAQIRPIRDHELLKEFPMSISRRTFIKSSAALAAAAALPARSWGRILGANDRLNIGVIGTGGQGTGHVENFMRSSEPQNLLVTRVCDVYRRRLNNAISKIKGNDSSGTMEYERVLDDKDINAVLIATPDHWHTKIAIEAMQAGKDVYVEKPLSLTIEQAIQCREAVKKTKRTLQVGPQGTSEDRWWKAGEAIKAGRIGKPVWSQAGYCRNSREGQFNWHIDEDAGPNAKGDGYVDWDRWLGSKYGLAPAIPWNPDHFFRFRKYWAYNGGVATDLMYHRLAPLLIAITGPTGEYPNRVVAAGGQYIEKDGRDIPDSFMLMIDYPSEHTIVLVSVMTNDVPLGDMIRGQHGTMEPHGSGWLIKEQGTWAKEFRESNKDLIKTLTEKNDKGEEKPLPDGRATCTIDATPAKDWNHVDNWLDAIRGKDKLHCNIDLGCSVMVAIKLGVESYRQQKMMKWDAKAERATS